VSPQTLQLRSDRQEIRLLSEWVDRFADQAELPGELRVNLQVALEEIATNIIRHAYQESGRDVFTVTLSREDGEIVATIIDSGPAFNPLALAPAETTTPFEARPIGGLGITFVRQLMDAVGYRRDGARNVLTLRCTLGRAPS
jgi:serine/threonine-protein kinase RsbW